MNMTDPVADMLTRIRNAVAARHTRVLIPASKMKLAIARVLKEEGYIKDIEILKDNPQGTIRVTLRYVDKTPVLTQLKRVSKPGLRVYTKQANIPRVRGGLGVAILSTPKGLMTGHSAYQQGLGGEVICYVWYKGRFSMSRIGRAPIPVPPKVQVNWDDGNLVSVKGPRGELSYQIDPELSLKLDDGTLTVSRPSDSKEHKAKHGLYRSLVNNMVVGVTSGYTKQLEIHGVGYRAAKVGENLVILVGYSHPVEVQPPKGISFTVDGVDPATKATRISVHGIDKQLVGEVAANIRRIRKPEPYKGKGIRYAGEAIRRKAGKAGKVGGKKK